MLVLPNSPASPRDPWHPSLSEINFADVAFSIITGGCFRHLNIHSVGRCIARISFLVRDVLIIRLVSLAGISAPPPAFVFHHGSRPRRADPRTSPRPLLSHLRCAHPPTTGALAYFIPIHRVISIRLAYSHRNRFTGRPGQSLPLCCSS